MRQNTPTYPVVERFISINGEGPRAGVRAAFIRMKGCNLHCSYCDTSWANVPDCPCNYFDIPDLIAWLKDEDICHVTLTGGEPLLIPSIGDLIEAIGAAGMEAEIETNGSVDITPFHTLPHRPAFTLDYKCPGSGMASYMKTGNYSLLEGRDTVKFVVGSREDLDRAYEINRSFRLGQRCHLYLSPVYGSIEPEEIVHYMLENRWNDVRLQLQLHKFIWPPDQRGV